jgi:hypothetical protein
MIKKWVRGKWLVDDLKEMKRILEIERDSRLHSVENLLCKRVWTCHKTDYVMNEWMNESISIYVFMIYSSELEGEHVAHWFGLDSGPSILMCPVNL